MEPTAQERPTHTTIHDHEDHPASGIKRAVTAILMVLTIGFAAYLLAGRPRTNDATNLVGLVGTEKIDPDPMLETGNPAEIEDALLATMGYRLVVPGIVGTKIVGVGTWDADRNVRIPVITYDDPQGDVSKVLVMNYALLDKISGAVFLDKSIRRELEQARSYAVVSTSDDREVVLWRAGDDIFLAIAERGAGRLIPRIEQSGSVS